MICGSARCRAGRKAAWRRPKALPGIATDHAAHGQAFPNRPVRLIVPTGAAGGIDLVARQLGQKLSDLWSRGVVVKNRVGAGGTIGAAAVAKAA